MVTDDGRRDRKCGDGRRERLEIVKSFCYVGDVIEAGGGVQAAVASRILCAWKNFMELKPILSRKGLSLKVKGRVYGACVRRVMLYGSETWGTMKENKLKMERTETQKVRMMCGVRLLERKRNEEREATVVWACDEERG